MPTKKNEVDEGPTRLPVTAAYEAALKEYTLAVECLRQGDFSRALEQFENIRTTARQEPELADRATTYARICERKLAPSVEEPVAGEKRFLRAVYLMNSGEVDDALQLLNRLQAESPMAVEVLYVRACAWALKGAAEKAVGDLRQAIAVDPKVRFQAVNDPDFERIREEPAFIDIIEPSPAGA